ncbi:MAG: glycosyltransferase family 4 protein [Deltaproteobacteria bacterium]|nr:glycosyltransferase family 4 protein [Deltaproteobacteria bacterium]
MVRIANRKSLSPKITILAYQIGQYGGIERMTLQVAQALQSAGCYVQGLSISSTGGRMLLEGIPVYGVQPRNIWLRRIYSRISHFYVPYCVGKLADSSEIILISHFHLLKYGVKVAQRFKAKVWLVGHGIEIWRDWNPVEKELLKLCDRIIAVSNYTANTVKNRLPNVVERVVVIPNTVNTELFTPNRVPIANVPRVILTVGRMSSNEAYKGHDLIIRALSNVQKRLGVPVEYHIVGEGNDKVRLQRIAQNCGVLKKVHFFGRLDEDEFLKAYQRCHVFAMPSYVSQRPDGSWTGEGFGIVYIEAAACGKPVLACDVGGQVDCIRHGETGILVKPTVESVESGLVEILSDLKKARRMGMVGRELVLNNFTREHFNRKWAELLKQT